MEFTAMGGISIMEGVEIGNEIRVWAGRDWIIEMLSTDFMDEYMPHARSQSR
jgi:hypothetical protein